MPPTITLGGNSSISTLRLSAANISIRKKFVYQYAVQVGGVDYITDCFDAFYEFAKVGCHVLPLDDFCIARKRRWQQSLVYQGLKAHHDGVVCGI